MEWKPPADEGGGKLIANRSKKITVQMEILHTFAFGRALFAVRL
jgi:hypothetical protein